MKIKISAPQAIHQLGSQPSQKDAIFPLTIKDNFTGNDRLFIVCDVKEQESDGELFSNIVCRVISDYIINKITTNTNDVLEDVLVEEAIQEAYQAIQAKQFTGTVNVSFALLCFHKGGCTLAHVGNCCIYHFRPTSYETLYCSQNKSACIVHVTDIKPDDYFFLCTDGMLEQMDDDDLLEIFGSEKTDEEKHKILTGETIDSIDNHSAYFLHIYSVESEVGDEKFLDDEMKSHVTNEILSKGLSLSSSAQLTNITSYPNMALLNGTLLQGGKYRILRLISEGGFEFTYEGIHTKFNKKVVIKEFCIPDYCHRGKDGVLDRASNGIFKAYMEQFLKSTYRSLDISHPNIVNANDVFQENNTAYEVMQFVEGQALSDYVHKKNGLSENEALFIIEEVCNIIHYLHKHELLHLDIKPKRFILGYDNQVFMVGLGIYPINISDESTYIIPFTRGYAPLELIGSSPIVSMATDVYELGATLYKLLTNKMIPSSGELLFEGNSELVKSLKQRAVSDRTIKCIKMAMEPLVKNRIQTVIEFANALGLNILQSNAPYELFKDSVVQSDETDYCEFEAYKESTAVNALPIGTILHSRQFSYEIVNVLGQGSFGITYLASVQLSGALGALESKVKVAVKEFFMRDINGRNKTSVTAGSKGGLYDKYKEKFKKESLHLSELKHPNIVKVLEAFEENNTYYYVMEYVEGMNLDSYIKKLGHIPLKETFGIVNEIGKALSFMHNHNMLHLDLKPQNVMRRTNGQIVLIDFGLSKQYDDDGEPESSTTVGGGTPGYAPIEQAAYHDGKGFPVTMDIYALSASLYKMLTGHSPQLASDILNEGLDEKSLIDCGMSSDVIGLIEIGMSPMKKERPQSVEAFLRLMNDL